MLQCENEEGNTEEGHGSRHGRPIKPAGGTGRCLLRAIGVNVLAPIACVYLTPYGKSTGRRRHRAGAFVHAYYALERYSLQQVRTLQARPWLYKITWNVYRNYISRSKPPVAVSLDTKAADFLLDLDDEWQERPEAIYEQGERRRELETLVETLPEPYREVIGLYYFDDLSHQEIADLLNRPVGTVKTHVHRGLRMLRKALQAKEGRSIR